MKSLFLFTFTLFSFFALKSEVTLKVKTPEERDLGCITLLQLASEKSKKDGKMNEDFSSKLKELETRIQAISGANISGKIISGNSLNTNAEDLTKTFKLISAYLKFKENKD